MLRTALLIGDVHTEAELLAATLAHASRVDAVLSVGDIVDGPHDPLRCIAMLRDCGAHVVRGNHERWVMQGHPLEPFDYPKAALAWIASLPRTREYETPAGKFLLGHGIGEDDMSRLTPDTTGYALECLDCVSKIVDAAEYRYVAGGHTHVPMVRRIGGVTFLNPGTLVATQEPGFMVVDFERGDVERWELLPSARLVERIALASSP